MKKIKYKLYSDNTVLNKNAISQILINRGIPYKEQDRWINAGWEEIFSPTEFPIEKLEKGKQILLNNVNDNKKIIVIVDSDVDGFSSAAIFINFLFKLFPEYTKENVSYILHTGKQHGLADCYENLELENGLLVIPDAGTNDIAEMQAILDKNNYIICLDHHESEKWLHDDRAVILNNQICNYPNKNLSGAGVTWQFCRYIDMNAANELLDLAALGALSDVMNYTSLETRAVIRLGLKNIKNPFFYYMRQKNDFSIQKMGGVNYMSIAFYVTPIVNAVCRSGTMEEKDIVFKSFLQMYAFEKIPSEKRGHKGELVPRVEEAIRIASNVKARQTKLQDESMKLLEDKIAENALTDNGIIVCLCEPGEVEKNLAGLCANKLQAKYQHPVLVLIRSRTKDDKEDFYRGSGRNYSMSEVQDLRQLCEDTGVIELAQGHANAFGFNIAASRLNDFIALTNKKYKDIPQDPVYLVDFIWRLSELNNKDILDIAAAKDYWGQGISEPYICIQDIPIGEYNIRLLSPDKNPTLKIHLDNGIDIMKFKSSQDEYEKFLNNTLLTAIVRAARNEWNGNVTAQLIIEDYQVRREWIF